MTELQNEVALLTAERDRARVQVATLQAENRRLRRMTRNGKQGRILHRAVADARQLVGWRFAGYSVTRRACKSFGMSERRWMWAVALLKLAGVLPINMGWADEFTVTDPDECTRRIDRATAKVAAADSLGMLIFRLPRNRVGVQRKQTPTALG